MLYVTRRNSSVDNDTLVAKGKLYQPTVCNTPYFISIRSPFLIYGYPSVRQNKLHFLTKYDYAFVFISAHTRSAHDVLM